MDIMLNDILKIQDLKNVRIRFNLSNTKWNAIRLYHEDPDLLLIGNFHNGSDKDEKVEKKKKRGRIWFKEGQLVIGLAQIQNDDWLLIDISKITKSYNKTWDGKPSAKINTFYEREIVREYEKYFGRLVVRFHKNQAYVTRTGESINLLVVKEILSDSFNSDLFPGYDTVNISWEKLKTVIDKEAWKTALGNQKGVYLICDCKNGKKYVGSAYGTEMLLGRWKLYIKNGHGGNTGLKKVKFDYIKKNFSYSILEIFKSTTDDKIVINRENWWKELLNTRNKKFGYNEN